MLTDLKIGAAFPTDHPLHAAPPAIFLIARRGRKVLREADVILSLDWVDLAGTLKQAWAAETIGAQVIQVSLDQVRTAAGAWTTRACRRSTSYLFCEPEAAVAAALLDA